MPFESKFYLCKINPTYNLHVFLRNFSEFTYFLSKGESLYLKFDILYFKCTGIIKEDKIDDKCL